ncbi:MAG: hypothetical protein V2J65_24400, partial [Desulfobacteraceae bacterium]|nr:hypothetical protein [Desulfobacteraceae bacterium]
MELKKIMLRFVFICVGISIIGGVGLYTFIYKKNKSNEQNIEVKPTNEFKLSIPNKYKLIIPEAYTSLWGLDININKNDVKFIKGEPDLIKENEDVWIYNCKIYNPKLKNEQTFIYVIKFNNGKLCRIFFTKDGP